MSRSTRLCLAALVLFAGCAAAPDAAPGAAQNVEIRAALAQLVACPDLDGARVGVQVADGATGAVLAQSMADRGFAPASNNKLLSAAIGLQSLGPRHRFATQFAIDAQVTGGRLAGNLYVIGGGDPTFGKTPYRAQQWQQIAAMLRAAGVERVGGRVVIDASWQRGPARGHGWQWDYLADDYAAPFGSFCCAGNVLDIKLLEGAGSEWWALDPPVMRPELWVDIGAEQNPRDAGEADLRVSRALGQQRAVIRGQMKSDAQRVSVAVADPSAFGEAVLTRALADHGIVVEGLALERQGKPVGIGSIQSPTVAEIVAPLLTNSDNLYAEQLFRTAARERDGAVGDAAVRVHAKSTLRALSVPALERLVMADGSGLSRRNLVQPRQLVALLRSVRQQPWHQIYRDALPIAGETGTLRSRFGDGPARGRVRAKTGFISRVVCLSGYVPRPSGEPLIFSVMLNDFTCETAAAKAACDRFVSRVCAAVGWRDAPQTPPR